MKLSIKIKRLNRVILKIPKPSIKKPANVQQTKDYNENLNILFLKQNKESHPPNRHPIGYPYKQHKSERHNETFEGRLYSPIK